jgi:hypothetical protein
MIILITLVAIGMFVVSIAVTIFHVAVVIPITIAANFNSTFAIFGRRHWGARVIRLVPVIAGFVSITIVMVSIAIMIFVGFMAIGIAAATAVARTAAAGIAGVTRVARLA